MTAETAPVTERTQGIRILLYNYIKHSINKKSCGNDVPCGELLIHDVIKKNTNNACRNGGYKDFCPKSEAFNPFSPIPLKRIQSGPIEHDYCKY